MAEWKLVVFQTEKIRFVGNAGIKGFFFKKRFCTKKTFSFTFFILLFLHDKYTRWAWALVTEAYLWEWNVNADVHQSRGRMGFLLASKSILCFQRRRQKKCSMSHSIIDKVNGWKEEKKVNGWILSQIWKIHYNVYCIYLLRSRVT